MPKLRLAASVPAIDWNSRSTGARVEASKLGGDVGQAACLSGNFEDLDQPVERARMAADDATDSAAGLTPITASPQP